MHMVADWHVSDDDFILLYDFFYNPNPNINYNELYNTLIFVT